MLSKYGGRKIYIVNIGVLGYYLRHLFYKKINPKYYYNRKSSNNFHIGD